MTLEEKNILLESCDWEGTDLLNRFKQNSEATKQLQLKVESGQKSNRGLSNDIRQMRTKIGRLEMVLDYYDERMSLLTYVFCVHLYEMESKTRRMKCHKLFSAITRYKDSIDCLILFFLVSFF